MSAVTHPPVLPGTPPRTGTPGRALMADSELVDLVRRACDGDTNAWDELVRRVRGLIDAITRSFRMTTDDAADVAQTTWLRLLESIDRVREPDRLGAWIATTARRECLRVLRSATRQTPSDELDRSDEAVRFSPPGHELIERDPRMLALAS